jgi:tetraacyldisaccharide-1-P 4'-kinase
MKLFLQQAWRKRGVTAIALYPLSLLYGLAFRVRTAL